MFTGWVIFDDFGTDGKPIPTELRNEEAALRQEIDLEDDYTASMFLLPPLINQLIPLLFFENLIGHLIFISELPLLFAYGGFFGVFVGLGGACTFVWTLSSIKRILSFVLWWFSF